MLRNKKTCVVLAMLAAFMLAGCAGVMQPATGGLYSDVSGPLGATSNSGYSKMGTSECTSILGWVALGDATIKTAMEAGGISKVHHIDYHASNILGIFAKLTVKVYGE